jgi:hypothetical protein
LLLLAAEVQRLYAYSLPDVERADALGSVYLVTADRCEVDSELLELQRDLSERLYAVTV